MSEFIGIRKGRNMLSVVAHVLLNLALAVGSTVVTLVSGSWILGILLVLLSKWRVVAVRPRYWWLNIKANLVDFIVGASLVLLVYYAGLELNLAHVALTVIYALWLVVIKPKSSELMAEVQALVAIFFGMSAAVLVGANLDPLLIVICGFVIGYGAGRHVLIQSEDHDFSLVTFVFGLLLAEVSFVLYHWLIMYSFGDTGVIVSQMAIVSSLLAFVLFKGYKSALNHDGKMRAEDVVMPALFSVIIVVLMIMYFSRPIFNV
ncbi:hypothetical protein FWF89_02960 [Candidatus Saccharibacteria bacterium]|nr:hypothetical protein [Candidatus Saccharibacteria bacterium]